MTDQTRDHTSGGRFTELRLEHCEELLAATTVGRIGFQSARGMEILPVNFRYRSRSILLRTSPYGPLAALAGGVDGVAFEVDHHDDLQQHGWSVLVRGRIAAVEDSAELAELDARMHPDPWAAGLRTLYLRLQASTITGRSVKRG